MIRSPFITTPLVAVLAIFASLILTPAVGAATTPPPKGGQALEIAPPVVNLNINPGQTVTTQISLRNVSNSRLLVTGSVEDFVAGGEDGTPKILLDEGETSPYSMKTWFRAVPDLLLNSRQLRSLPVTIAVPANAAPGGYFAVVRFSGTAPELDSTGVSLSASLGALILVRVNGAAKEGMEVKTFIATHKGGSTGISLFESAPVSFVERLKNTGNVHEQPAGQIAISDMFGKKIAAVNINLPPRNVLPQSTRKFEQALDSSVIGNKVLFGRYTAKLSVKYGTQGQTTTSSVSFWVIPYKLIIGGIIGLIAAFFILRTLIRNYNRSIIKKAQKSKRK